MKCHCNEIERLRKQRDEANSRTLRMWERAKTAEDKLAKIEKLADDWTCGFPAEASAAHFLREILNA